MGSHYNITCILSVSKCSRMILGMTLSDHKCKYPSHIPMLQTVVRSVMTWERDKIQAGLKLPSIMFTSRPVKLSLEKSRSCLNDNWQCLSLVSG